MNTWLWAAAVLAAMPAVLMLVAVGGSRLDGVIAMQAAGASATLALLLIAVGTDRQGFADLALVLAVTSFAGTVAFLRYIQRVR
jgi:multicomponent Na+:H+ antiporter subunit F